MAEKPYFYWVRGQQFQGDSERPLDNAVYPVLSVGAVRSPNDTLQVVRVECAVMLEAYGSPLPGAYTAPGLHWNVTVGWSDSGGTDAIGVDEPPRSNLGSVLLTPTLYTLPGALTDFTAGWQTLEPLVLRGQRVAPIGDGPGTVTVGIDVSDQAFVLAPALGYHLIYHLWALVEVGFISEVAP